MSQCACGYVRFREYRRSGSGGCSQHLHSSQHLHCSDPQSAACRAACIFRVLFCRGESRTIISIRDFMLVGSLPAVDDLSI